MGWEGEAALPFSFGSWSCVATSKERLNYARVTGNELQVAKTGD
jgi:hypothetical protein